MKSIDGFSNKMKYMFNKPGWMPEEMGGYQPAPTIDKGTYHKFETASPMKLNLYVLYQYALSLALTAFFLFNQAQFDLSTKGFLAAGIIVTIMNCGLLFENRNWAKYIEHIRIVVVGIVLYISFNNGWDLVYLTGSLLYGLVSGLWLLSLGKLNKDPLPNA